MDILEKARRALEQPVCNHCLGRQFGQLLSGTSNQNRGELLRRAAAMSIDKEKPGDEDKKIDMSNFSGIKFHLLKDNIPEAKACSVCGDIFSRLDSYVKKAVSKASKLQFSTFLVGTRLSANLLDNEERMWENIGIDWAEQLKAELNREIGSRLEKDMEKKFDPKNPDVVFLVEIAAGKVSVSVNPMFIYGEYQKLKRGIPQTKWPTGKYKTSVEQIAAKPFMAATKGSSHSFHGLGREDIDARCLAWRPFVLEIKEPKLRKLQLQRLQNAVNKDPRIKVKRMRLSSMREVRELKESRADKSYDAVVQCRKPIDKSLLKELKKLKTEIRQRTPQRVLHRRADLRRKRRVKSIRASIIGRKKLQLRITTDAGLYIKELISGDKGRTQPNLSQLLQNECVCKELDVVKIHLPRKEKTA